MKSFKQTQSHFLDLQLEGKSTPFQDGYLDGSYASIGASNKSVFEKASEKAKQGDEYSKGLIVAAFDASFTFRNDTVNNVAPSVKGNKEKYMENQNVNNQERTPAEKAKYYADRVDNVNLTAGQRRWASIRLNQLTNPSAGSSQPTKAQARASTSAALQPITDKCCAESAGIGYGSAKAGRRVPVDKSVKDSFSNGVKLGRGGK